MTVPAPRGNSRASALVEAASPSLGRAATRFAARRSWAIAGVALLGLAGCSDSAPQAVAQRTSAPPGTPTCDADLSTDPQSCGACGHACLGGACAGGVCQPVTLAENINLPTALALDDSSIYVGLDAPPEGGATYAGLPCGDQPQILAFSRASGAQSTLLPCGKTYSTDAIVQIMTVAADTLYWQDHDDGNPSVPVNEIFTMAANGTTPTPWGDAGCGRTLLVDSTAIFYVSCASYFLTASTLDGASKTPLSSDRLPDLLAMDASNIYYTTRQTCAQECEDDGSIRVVPKAGGNPVDMVTDLWGVGALAVRDGYVYFSTPGHDPDGNSPLQYSIERVAVGGGTVERVSSGHSVTSLAVDASDVWFVDFDDQSAPTNGVYKAPRAGGATTQVYAGAVSAFAMDDTVSVWGTGSDPHIVPLTNTLMMVAK